MKTIFDFHKSHPHIWNKLHDTYYVEMAHAYAEPGYSLQDKLHIMLANWNNVPKGLVDALEEHYSLEWFDEWYFCNECGCIIRTSPDCYQWTPYYHIFTDGDVICGTCISEDSMLISRYIDTLIDNPKSCSVFSLPWEEMGWTVEKDTFESGMHTGMDADPPTIFKYKKEAHPDREYIFINLIASQFYITYQTAYRQKEAAND